MILIVFTLAPSGTPTAGMLSVQFAKVTIPTATGAILGLGTTALIENSKRKS